MSKFIEDPIQLSRAQMELFAHVSISSNKNKCFYKLVSSEICVVLYCL